MQPSNYQAEPVPQIDSVPELVRDTANMVVITTGLLFSKLMLRGDMVPPPLDWGNHVANSALTGTIAGTGWALARNIKLARGDKSPEGYKLFMRKGWLAAAALSVAVNVGIEYAPLEYRQKYDVDLVTSDPVDIAYGVGGGLLLSSAMTSRLRRNIRDIESDKTPRPLPGEATSRPAIKINSNANKSKRKMQQASRKKNRR